MIRFPNPARAAARADTHRCPVGGLAIAAGGRLLAAWLLLLTTGCFDAEALIETRRRQELLLQLEEIDLGQYNVTLPRLPGESRGGVVSFHAFGQVANKDHPQVKSLLQNEGPELRHEIMLAVRALPDEAVKEPHLNTLRGRISEVINRDQDGELVQAIGFYTFSFSAL